MEDCAVGSGSLQKDLNRPHSLAFCRLAVKWFAGRIQDLQVYVAMVERCIAAPDLPCKLLLLLTRKQFGRNLTLERLSEAVLFPLCPDRGECIGYDPSLAASVYLENDLQMLHRT